MRQCTNLIAPFHELALSLLRAHHVDRCNIKGLGLPLELG
jgi:hypothetical protein